MTDKHNFTFRVRVQGLKGQPQSSHSKSFFNESILSILWSKPFLFMTHSLNWPQIFGPAIFGTVPQFRDRPAFIMKSKYSTAILCSQI